MKEVRLGPELKRALEARDRARSLRTTMTPAEQILWAALRSRRLDGIKFRRQFSIDCFILDFYCQELKLVVELDGEVHSEPNQVAHDQNRDAYLQSLGCKVLRFPNQAVQTDLASVLRAIAQSARDLSSPQTGSDMRAPCSK